MLRAIAGVLRRASCPSRRTRPTSTAAAVTAETSRLDELTAQSPDWAVQQAVTSWSAASVPDRLQQLSHIGAGTPASIEGLLRRIVSIAGSTTSPGAALELIYDWRELAAKQHAHDAAAAPHAPWKTRVEDAATVVLREISGPLCVRVEPLSVSPYAPPYISSLAATARDSESVHKTSSHVEFMTKFGHRRMVHAAYHVGLPRDLLAVLYSAFLPGMPRSMADIEEASGGPPPPAGRWDHSVLWHLPQVAAATALADAAASAVPLSPPAATTTTTTTTSAAASAASERPVTTVAFYSVGSHHAGMRGLKMGTRIIYAAASEIAEAAERHHHHQQQRQHHDGHDIRTFCTLSPIPGFVDWLEVAAGLGKLGVHLDADDVDAIEAAGEATGVHAHATPGTTAADAAGRRLSVMLLTTTSQPPQQPPSPPASAASSSASSSASPVSLPSPSWSSSSSSAASASPRPTRTHLQPLHAPPLPVWWVDEGARAALRPVLAKLCRHYLLTPVGKRGQPACKVAAFHLGNGAALDRILWGADASPAGLRRSAGLMVNYVYSKTGTQGLRDTIRLRAAEFAADPAGVLARQDPVVLL